jgi:hypothetical protein
MRTTVNLDEALIDQAQRITGLTERAALFERPESPHRARKRSAFGAPGRQRAASQADSQAALKVGVIWSIPRSTSAGFLQLK